MKNPAVVLGLCLGFTACDTPSDPGESAVARSDAIEAAAAGPYYVPMTLTSAGIRGQAINNKGQVVGWGSGAFIWQNGVRRDLGSLGGGGTLPFALNDAGQVVGHSWTNDGDAHAFLWQNGTMRDLGTLGAPSVPGQIISSATGINATGQIVGGSQISNGSQRAFLWQNGRMTRLASLDRVYSLALAIDNLGRIVGEFGQPTAKAFRWTEGTVRSLGTLGGTSTASAISAGKIVGWYGIDASHPRAFIWQSGVMTDLGTLGGDWITAEGINPLGQVVGYGRTAGSNIMRAYVWENGVMTNLGMGQAHGINRNGWIVGERPNPRLTRNLDMLPTIWKPSATPPVTPSASILVGNIFFYSEHNSSIQPTVDTVAAWTTVTWEWINTLRAGHSVQSIGSPSFASSPIITTRDAKYRVTFTRPGVYRYNCVSHPTAMTGRIVVR